MALPPTYKTRLVKKEIFTHDTRDFTFDLLEPNVIDFKAGQFLLIKTTSPETGKMISRAYSIASAPQLTNQVVFNIEIVEGGQMTTLMDTWEIGTEIEMQGPFGHFVQKSEPTKDLIFVATGTGVAPMRSMIEDRLAEGSTQKIHLLFGVRCQDNIFYKELFEDLAEKYENFTFTLTLSRPKEGWEGSTGRVTAILPELDLDPTKTDAYLCGGKPMIDDVRQIFENKGFEASSVYFEQFFL